MKPRNPDLGAVYLNVDLEIRSQSNLMPLVDALRPRLFVLHAGRVRGAFFASFEISGLTLPPDMANRRLARVLSDLPPSVRSLWKRAHDRVYEIGLRKTAGRATFSLAFRPETVKRIARMNARVALTLYSHARLPRKRKLPTAGVTLRGRDQREAGPIRTRRRNEFEGPESR